MLIQLMGSTCRDGGRPCDVRCDCTLWCMLYEG